MLLPLAISSANFVSHIYSWYYDVVNHRKAEMLYCDKPTSSELLKRYG